MSDDTADQGCFERIYGPGASPEITFSPNIHNDFCSIKDVCRLLKGLAGIGLTKESCWRICNAPLISMVNCVIFQEIKSDTPRESHEPQDESEAIEKIFQEFMMNYAPLSESESRPCLSLLSNRESSSHQVKELRIKAEEKSIRQALTSMVLEGSTPSDQSIYESIQSAVPEWYELATSFILSDNHLVNHGYQTSENHAYLEPKKDLMLKEVSQILAIDCEMCLSNSGRELCRISVVDALSNKMLLDSFVLPENVIIDYLTTYSGIVEEDLQTCSTSLQDIQKNLLDNFIFPDTILVGHSLENDLHALRIRHHRIIDTAVLYPHPMDECKHSLKYLARKYLKRLIQSSSHDSIEDSIACADLLKLKIINGPNFGKGRKRDSVLMELIQQGTPCTIIDRPSHIEHLLKDNPAIQGSNRLNLVLANSNDKVEKRALTVFKEKSQRNQGSKFSIPEFVFCCRSKMDTQSMRKSLITLFDAAPMNSIMIVIASQKRINDLQDKSSPFKSLFGVAVKK